MGQGIKDLGRCEKRRGYLLGVLFPMKAKEFSRLGKRAGAIGKFPSAMEDHT